MLYGEPAWYNSINFNKGHFRKGVMLKLFSSNFLSLFFWSTIKYSLNVSWRSKTYWKEETFIFTYDLLLFIYLFLHMIYLFFSQVKLLFPCNFLHMIYLFSRLFFSINLMWLILLSKVFMFEDIDEQLRLRSWSRISSWQFGAVGIWSQNLLRCISSLIHFLHDISLSSANSHPPACSPLLAMLTQR